MSQDLNIIVKAKVDTTDLNNQLNDATKDKQIDIKAKLSEVDLSQLDKQLENFKFKFTTDNITSLATAIKKLLKENKFDLDLNVKNIQAIQNIKKQVSNSGLQGKLGNVDLANGFSVEDINMDNLQQKMRKIMKEVDPTFFKKAIISNITNSNIDGELKSFVVQGENASGVVKKLFFNLQQSEEGIKNFALTNINTLDKQQQQLKKAEELAGKLERQFKKLNDNMGLKMLDRARDNGLTVDKVNEIGNKRQDVRDKYQAGQDEISLYNKRLQLMQLINKETRDLNLSEERRLDYQKQIYNVMRNQKSEKDKISQLSNINNAVSNEIKAGKEQINNTQKLVELETRRSNVAKTLTDLRNSYNKSEFGNEEYTKLNKELELLQKVTKYSKEADISLKQLESQVKIVQNRLTGDANVQKNLGAKNELTSLYKQLEDSKKLQYATEELQKRFDFLGVAIKRDLSTSDIQRYRKELQELTKDIEKAIKSASVTTPVANKNNQGLVNAVDNYKSDNSLEKHKADLDQVTKSLLGQKAVIKDIIVEDRQLDGIVTKFNASIQTGQKDIKQYTYELNHLTQELRVVREQLVNNPNKNLGLFEQLKIAMERVPVWMISMTAFYGTINALRSAMSTIVEIDGQVTQMKRVMDADTNFTDIMNTSIESAEKFGKTITDVNQAMIEFSKQGFKGQELKDIVNTSILASNVSDMSTAETLETLTSVMNSYKIEAKDTIGVIDSLNQVDNDFATSVKDLSLGLTKSSAVANNFGKILCRPMK
jgi:hypothetical protein